MVRMTDEYKINKKYLMSVEVLIDIAGRIEVAKYAFEIREMSQIAKQ